MTIRRLDSILADRIAAGEVVERPSAAVKELLENALDAGATRIDVTIEGGGQKLIRIIDDGCGMDPADLALCIERHATSKIPDGDLTNIATLGFRGEALPSIASVARLEILSRAQESSHGWGLRVEFGEVGAPAPASLAKGPGSKSATCSPPRRRGSNFSKARAPRRRRWPMWSSVSPWPMRMCVFRSAAKA